MDRNRHLHIVVAAATRRRPKMLAALLRSLCEMRAPPACSVGVLIVENDSAPASSEVIATAREGFPVPLRHVLETGVGISRVRNRAVAEADADGADLLAFVDDDEEVTPTWLVNIVAAYRASDALLIGGPVEHQRPEGALSPSEDAIFQAAAEDMDRRTARRNRHFRAGACDRIAVYTHNWLGDMALFRDHGLAFDESIGLSGGGDTQFFYRTVAKGLPTGWAPDALVRETQPASRLTLGYQYRRARDQERNNWVMQFQRGPKHRPSRFKLVRRILSSGLSLVLMAPVYPLLATRGKRGLAIKAGRFVGRVLALSQKRSLLYTYGSQTGY